MKKDLHERYIKEFRKELVKFIKKLDRKPYMNGVGCSADKSAEADLL